MPSAPLSALILIVEDDDDIASLLWELLRHEGYRVERAADGVDGIAMARFFLPDLIILDMLMPVMDGLETARTLRLFPETMMTPILAISALYIDDAHEAARQAGVTSYIDKPFDIRTVLARVALLLAKDSVA